MSKLKWSRRLRLKTYVHLYFLIILWSYGDIYCIHVHIARCCWLTENVLWCCCADLRQGARCIKWWRVMTKTLCTHKEEICTCILFVRFKKLYVRLVLFHKSQSLWNWVHMHEPFHLPQSAINGCRNALKHLFVYWYLCPLCNLLDLSMRRMAKELSLWSSSTAPEQLSLHTAVAIYNTNITNSSRL